MCHHKGFGFASIKKHKLLLCLLEVSICHVLELSPLQNYQPMKDEIANRLQTKRQSTQKLYHGEKTRELPNQDTDKWTPANVKWTGMEPRSYIVLYTIYSQAIRRKPRTQKKDRSQTGNNTAVSQLRVSPSFPPKVISNKINPEARHLPVNTNLYTQRADPLTTRSGRVT